AEAPKEMTQADRLAEAERIERKNAKSLNRWETMEKRRAEEQAARLAALKERKLEGAVVTFYSSAHTYRGPKIEHLSLGPGGVEDMMKKRGPKPKPLKAPLGVPLAAASGAFVHPNIAPANAQSSSGSTPVNPSHTAPKGPESQPSGDGWLAGIPEFTSMPLSSGCHTPHGTQAQSPAVIESTEQKDVVIPPQEPASQIPISSPQKHEDDQKDDANPPLMGAQAAPRASDPGIQHAPEIPQPVAPESEAQSLSVPSRIDPSAVASHRLAPQSQDAPVTLVTNTASPQSLQQPTSPAVPMVEITSTRNLVILDKFEGLAADAMQAYSFFYNKKTTKQAKPVKQLTETCAVTGLPAKYRDPVSRLGYANVAAYKKLREVQKHGFQWSSMLGCYVGRVDHAARGVPEDFLTSSS
ncbi:hypothetical protein H2198_010943, partial [Neophaeococcomyces mojaviensis]